MISLFWGRDVWFDVFRSEHRFSRHARGHCGCSAHSEGTFEEADLLNGLFPEDYISDTNENGRQGAYSENIIHPYALLPEALLHLFERDSAACISFDGPAKRRLTAYHLQSSHHIRLRLRSQVYRPNNVSSKVKPNNRPPKRRTLTSVKAMSRKNAAVAADRSMV
jgi:hypothetical protein